MRVARVSYEFSPQKGGSITNMIELLRQLSKKKIEQIVYVPNRVGGDEDKPFGVSKLVKIDTVATDNDAVPIPLRLLLFALPLSRKINDQNNNKRIDILHVNGFLLGLLLSILLKLSGVSIPLIITRDGGFGDRNSIRHVISELISYFSIIFTRAHFFIVDDGTDIQPCIDFLNKMDKKYTLIRTAIDCSNIEPEKYTLTESKAVKIVSTHRLIEFKNIEDLIMAFIEATRNDSNSPSELIIIGTGNQESVLKKLVENAGVKNIYFLGEMDHQRIIEMLPKCDIFVATSRISNVNLSVLEGMASMLPIIAYNSGGTNQLIKNYENGILVDVDDIQGLSNALNLLIHDKELRYQLGKSARRDIQNERSWDCVVDAYYFIYCNLLNYKIVECE